MQRQAIMKHVAPSNPADALDLLWQFIGLAGPVLDRCDDDGGTLMSEFHAACGDLGVVATRMSPDPEVLAEQTFRALAGDYHGQFDGLVGVLAPALGPVGLDRLKTRVEELSRAPVPVPRQEDRKVVGWSGSGPFYADQIAQSHRDRTVEWALAAIADAQGDVDAFIALQDVAARRMPRVAAEIGERLLRAGPPEEALAGLDAIDRPGHGWLPGEWQEARFRSLEALGRSEEAQAFLLVLLRARPEPVPPARIPGAPARLRRPRGRGAGARPRACLHPVSRGARISREVAGARSCRGHGSDPSGRARGQPLPESSCRRPRRWRRDTRWPPR